MSSIPVLVLTGFLGSGKTTLINRILSESHGKRLAVIENEFGEVGVDNDLVVGADEEIFEMNNGCLCCTVRGDLIRILGNLAKRKDRIDLVLIETTGLADPGPVAQTFFMDDDIAKDYVVKGIITVVDALHAPLHLDSSPEASRQVAFADLLLINKTDLVGDAERSNLRKRLQGMNPLAPQVETQMSQLPLSRLLDLGGFSLDRALSLDAAFLEVERPFESALKLPGSPRPLKVRWQPGADSVAKAAILSGSEFDPDQASRLFDSDTAPSDCLEPGVVVAWNVGHRGECALELPPGDTGWLVFEHRPEEFSLELVSEETPLEWAKILEFRPNHQHDDVSSVGLTSGRPLDPQKFMTWLRTILARFGAEIYRSKGILYFKGDQNRHIFQGVHMLLTGDDLGPWKDEIPQNKIVFIGKNLDRELLTQGFEKCLR